MHQEEFKKLLDELDGNSVKTLVEKNARYSAPDDCLHNFTAGADILGGTPAQACWGYLTKHLVALRDMVERDDFSNREDFLEKCQDSINYIRFIWCLGNEKRKDYVSEGTENTIFEDIVPEGVSFVVFKRDGQFERNFGRLMKPIITEDSYSFTISWNDDTCHRTYNKSDFYYKMQ